MLKDKARRIAIIDLGSNTARLIVMKAVAGHNYHLDDEIREVVRLRQGMTRHGLSQNAVERAIFTMRLFKRFCDSLDVDIIIATATSAVRDAPNGPLFIDRVEREIGLSLRILDGETEAYYGVLGVLNEHPIGDGYVLDIGGGSAQISKVKDRKFKRGQSFKLGALALTERFVTTDPIDQAEYEAIQADIETQLSTFSWPKKNERPLIGLGGTIRNLAKVEAARQGYPLNTLHGFRLTVTSIEESITLFRELPLDKRKNISGLKKDRADIILPGAMVALAVMKKLDVKEMIISTNGLREGIFFEQFWGHLHYPVISEVRRFSVLNMARTYRYQKAHASHVRFLTRRLFEQLHSLHGYGIIERALLDAASLLHDLGTIISYDDHHKHSLTLIINSGLPGFTPKEIALIALLCRYHRSGTPNIKDYKLILNKDDQLLLTRLSAILRFAEFLERGRNASVDDVTILVDDKNMYLTLIAEEYPAVELWQAERNAVELMESAFNRKIHLESTAAPTEWPVDENGKTKFLP